MSVNLGTAIGYLDLDISKFTAGLTTATGQMSQAESKFSSVGSGFQAVGSQLKSVGTAMTAGLTLPIVGIGTAAVKMTMDYEKQMSRVQAISGATGESMVAIKEKAREMGEGTIYSATEAGQAFEYMALAGWKDEEMLKGIEPILKLAGAAQMDLGQASDIVTDNLTAFGMSAGETTRFVDVMSATMSNSNTDVTMLGEAFKYVAPLAGNMGYSVEDVSLALGTMSNSGIKASQAGTSLRRMLLNMASPTNEVKTAMDNLGVSMFDSEGKALPLRDVLEQLRSSLQSGGGDLDAYRDGIARLSEQLDLGIITEEEYNQALIELAKQTGVVTDEFKAQELAALAGATGMSGLAAIVGASNEDWNALAEAIDNSNGSAESMYDMMTDNLWGSFQELISSVKELAMEFGELLLPVVKDIVEAIKGVVEWFKNLDDGQKQIIITIAEVVAVIGPVLLIIGQVATAIGAIISVVSTVGTVLSGLGTVFGLLTNPIGLVIAAIAAVVTGLIALYNNCEEFRNFVDGLISFIAELPGKIAEIFKTIVSAVGDFIGNVIDFFAELPGKIAEFFGNIIDTVKNWVVDMAQQAIENNKKFIEATINFFKELPGKIAEFFSNIINTVKDWVVNMAKQAIENNKKFIEATVNFFKELPGKIAEFFSNIINTVKDWVVNMAQQAIENNKKFIEATVNFFKELPGKIADFLKNIINSVKEWVTNMGQKAAEAGKAFFENLWNILKSIPEKVVEIGKNIIEGIWNGISGAFTWLKDKVFGIFGGLIDGVKGLFGIHSPSKVFEQEIGKYLPLGMAVGFEKAMPEAMRTIQDSINDGMDELTTENVELKPEVDSDLGIKDFSDSLKKIYSSIAEWMEDTEGNIQNTVSNMAKGLAQIISNFNVLIILINSTGKEFERLAKTFIQVFDRVFISFNELENKMNRSISNMIERLNSVLSVGQKVSAMNNELNNGFNNLSNTFTNVFNNILQGFETMESKLSASISKMVEELNSLITTGQQIGTMSDGLVLKEASGSIQTGLYGNNYGSYDSRYGYDTGTTINNFNFTTDQPIDEIEAAKLLKRTQRDIAEGFMLI